MSILKHWEFPITCLRPLDSEPSKSSSQPSQPQLVLHVPVQKIIPAFQALLQALPEAEQASYAQVAKFLSDLDQEDKTNPEAQQSQANQSQTSQSQTNQSQTNQSPTSQTTANFSLGFSLSLAPLEQLKGLSAQDGQAKAVQTKAAQTKAVQEKAVKEKAKRLPVLTLVNPLNYQQLWINYAHINQTELFLSHGDISQWPLEPEWVDFARQTLTQLQANLQLLQAQENQPQNLKQDSGSLGTSSLSASTSSLAALSAPSSTTPTQILTLTIPKIYCFTSIFSIVDIRKLLKLIQLKTYGRNGIQAQCEAADIGKLMWMLSLGLDTIPVLANSLKDAQLLASYAGKTDAEGSSKEAYTSYLQLAEKLQEQNH